MSATPGSTQPSASEQESVIPPLPPLRRSEEVLHQPFPGLRIHVPSSPEVKQESLSHVLGSQDSIPGRQPTRWAGFFEFLPHSSPSLPLSLSPATSGGALPSPPLSPPPAPVRSGASEVTPPLPRRGAMGARRRLRLPGDSPAPYFFGRAAGVFGAQNLAARVARNSSTESPVGSSLDDLVRDLFS